MTLTQRIEAATRCAVDECERQKAPDAAVCREDLNELWSNRLVRQADGTYRRRRPFAARDLTYSRIGL